MGTARTAGFSRLYLFPGMYHCSNGEGPYQVDLLTPMMAWVEGGTAPDAVVAQRPKQAAGSDFGAPTGPPGGMKPAAASPATVEIVRSRPVYPWPHLAVYAGTGDPAQASSFLEGKAIVFTMPQWAGSAFFTPYSPQGR